MKKILFIGGYNSKGRKADTLENKQTEVYRLLPDYDSGLNQWIEQAKKMMGEHGINEVHASSTGAQVACKLGAKKMVLYSPVINPFQQPKANKFTEKFLSEASLIKQCTNCIVVIPEKDEVLDNAVTIQFCKDNGIIPIVSENDDHGLTKYFSNLLKPTGPINKETISLTMTLLVKKDKKIVVPVDSEGWVKEFIFKTDKIWLQQEMLDDEQAENLIMQFSGYDRYFREFLLELGFHEEQVHIGSIEFELDKEHYSFSYMNTYFLEDYWIESNHITYGEDYSMMSDFDYYGRMYGHDDENFKFSF